MERKKMLRRGFVAIYLCLAVLCTALFAGSSDVQAKDYWEAFQVKLTPKGSVKAGQNVTFKVSIQNMTKKTLKTSWINPIYYRDTNNSEKYPGVDFGKLKDSKGKLVQWGDEVTFSPKQKKTFTLSGKIPKTWGRKGEILIVVGSKKGKDFYAGQGGYLGKNSSTTKETALKGTKLSSVKSAKKKATVSWKKQTTGTTGYQIQYSLNKDFKGAKVKTVNSNKKTSLTINNLKSKKTYYVRVRTYKKKSAKNTYSSWSSAKTVKIK